MTLELAVAQLADLVMVGLGVAFVSLTMIVGLLAFVVASRAVR